MLDCDWRTENVSLHGEIKLTNGRRDKALKNEEEKK
jgi:hypothetical protein